MEKRVSHLWGLVVDAGGDPSGVTADADDTAATEAVETLTGTVLDGDIGEYTKEGTDRNHIRSQEQLLNV